jgi:hypothetical protein
MTQSSLSAATIGNYYYNLSTGTTIPGRYDQVTFDGAGNWINTGLVSGIQDLCDDSYVGTCETAPSGWYYEAGSAYAVYYDSVLGYVTNEYYFPPVYNISASPTTVDEQNRTITFTVDTQYLADESILYWELGPYNANSNDLVENVYNGYVIIYTTSGVNGQGQFQLTTKPDNLTEGAEWLVVKLTDAGGGNVFDTVNVRILDSSLTPTATPIIPTATPVPPTATAVPAPTATSAPSGTCYHVWVADMD